MKLKDRVLMAAVPPLAYYLIKFIGRTQKVRYIGLDNIRKVFREQGNAIIAFWHNRIFGIPYNYRRLFGDKRIVTLSSRSRDGEYSTRIQRQFGGETIRGSSSRGGSEALKKLVREIQSGKDCAITPDGPQGPKYSVHEGAVAVAKLSGVPIVPVSYDCTRKRVLKSWDNFIVPLPFGRMVFVFGEPIYTELNGNKLSTEDLRAALKDELMRITALSEKETQVIK
jgi:lysophospholipid acyltransferase (LPLAT)-like uncharacterized protein